MKLLHTADWHLGDRLGRVDRSADLRNAVERVAGYCEQEQVELLLVAGDLFSELSRPDGLRESVEHLQQVFLPFLRGGGTVVALTGNHDNENFCQTLRSAMTLAAPLEPNVAEAAPAGRFYLAAAPGLLRLADKAGHRLQLVLLPFPTPSRYLGTHAQRYRNVEEKNRALAEACRLRLRQLHAQPDFDPTLPTVLAAHVHMQGARLSSLVQMSPSQGLLLEPGDLPTGYAYVALGHIHQPQCLWGQPHIRYCGSIERLDLGERTDDKSVTLVEIGPQGLAETPVCLPLPATPLYDVVIDDPRSTLPTLRDRYPDAGRALVRYHVTYTAGADNLEEVLSELDRIFPRWYERDWQEATSRNLLSSRMNIGTPQGFHDMIRTYLQTELADHPDRVAVCELADELLAEEP